MYTNLITGFISKNILFVFDGTDQDYRLGICEVVKYSIHEQPATLPVIWSYRFRRGISGLFFPFESSLARFTHIPTLNKFKKYTSDIVAKQKSKPTTFVASFSRPIQITIHFRYTTAVSKSIALTPVFRFWRCSIYAVIRNPPRRRFADRVSLLSQHHARPPIDSRQITAWLTKMRTGLTANPNPPTALRSPSNPFPGGSFPYHPLARWQSSAAFRTSSWWTSFPVSIASISRGCLG